MSDTLLREAPFFIVGCPRSGTTLLQRMLDAHPEVAVAPETFFVRRFWAQRETYGDLDDAANLYRLLGDIAATSAFDEMGLDPDSFRASAVRSDRQYGTLLDLLLAQFAERRSARVVGEKTPDHALHLPVLRRFFPEARFVHVVRDPRAVVNSWRSVPWTSGYRWRDAEVWIEHVAAVRAAGPLLEGRLHTLHFEHLVRRPERELRSLCAFLDLAFDPAMLAFHDRRPQTVDVGREPWKRGTTQPVDPDVADRWRTELSAAALAQVEAVAGAEMKRWGYALRSTPGRRRWAGLRIQLERPLWKLALVVRSLQTSGDARSPSSAV